jgi:CRISPR-associated protein Cmr3
MSWYFIEPTDVLFFRDAKPFGAAEDHLATSIFPPNPRTVAGAFRSMILGSSDVGWRDFLHGSPEAQDIRDQIGSPDGILNSQFSMKGPFLALRTSSSWELHTVLPSDAFVNDQEIKQFDMFSPILDSPFVSLWPDDGLHPLWPPGGKRKDLPRETYWIGQDSIRDYTQGRTFTAKLEKEIIQYEPRIGNALNLKTRTARDQHLYQATFINLRAVSEGELEEVYGFVVWLSETLEGLPDSGYLSLGGESRAAKFSKLPKDFDFNFGLAEPTKRFKVVLMTPAYFKAGWAPAGNNWEAVLGFDAKLLAASLEKPLFLGGYDVANGDERAMHSFVAPGSVYYFETKEPVKQLEKPFTESISAKTPLGRMGYGQAFLGQWDWQSFEEDK